MDKKSGTFTTLNGDKYTITGLTRMMIDRVSESVKMSWELEDKRPLPQRPTYVVSGEDVFGGEDAVYYHTEETLETDEDKDAWAKYKSEQSELDARIYKQMMYASFNCVEVPLEELQRYVRDQRDNHGLSLPDPKKYGARVKRVFVEDNVICNDETEMMRLFSEALKVAGVIQDEEAAVAMESFRDSQVKQEREPAPRQDSSEPTGDS
jgi:hypothetical protein